MIRKYGKINSLIHFGNNTFPMKFSVISVLLASAVMAFETRVCRLNVLGRGIIGANVHIQIHKLPIRKVKINYSVWKKLSGYHPFLFNVTVDLCHHMKHPNPLTVFYYFYGALLPFINVNHTCPINHDLILKNFVLDNQMFSKVPIPKGSYMFMIKIIADGEWRSTIYDYLDVNVDDGPRTMSG